jgi:hypothetical protein
MDLPEALLPLEHSLLGYHIGHHLGLKAPREEVMRKVLGGSQDVGINTRAEMSTTFRVRTCLKNRERTLNSEHSNLGDIIFPGIRVSNQEFMALPLSPVNCILQWHIVQWVVVHQHLTGTLSSRLWYISILPAHCPVGCGTPPPRCSCPSGVAPR